MSPALLKKYLAVARHVADHVVLKPEGFVFAPHPVVTETDRDKYCVQRIIDFYKRHPIDYADYFLAAWKYKHRAALGQPDAGLCCVSGEMALSEKYLKTVWTALNAKEADVGPLVAVRKLWDELSAPDGKGDPARKGCAKMRDLVVNLRKQLKTDVKKLNVNGISNGSQTFILWRNRQAATKRRSYTGDVSADLKKLTDSLKGADAGLVKLFTSNEPEKARKSLERFCNVFPDAFFLTGIERGRPLTAGFHLMQGHFRDDQPLCELILDDAERGEIDALWHELDFLTLAPMRQYADFIFFERAEPPRYMAEAEFDFARSEDKDSVSEAKMARLGKLYLAKALKRGANGDAVEAIETYFTNISAEVRKVERGRLAAEASHLDSLVKFAERAYRRPLSKAERDDLLAFYRTLRKQDDPGHEEALRDALTSVLMSPHFCFRFTRSDASKQSQPLSDHELANRLSYFLWSSMPDAELLTHAEKGDLHKPEVLIAETKRMLRDPKVRGLATEFAGNWLDIRRFEEHNAVDRERFKTFTNDLRAAMFEEPIRYFIDVAQRNRSVLDFVYGNDTFVNPLLAKHYGIQLAPRPSSLAPQNDWVHIENAQKYGRGGLLPMAVFMTKNAPGLRTSPVKRGYWMVRRVLGEQIPPPPPTVPELPTDEAKTGELSLPQLLARHRDNKSCAGCHNRFDAVGVVFEGFGPIGERRTKDLGGRPVATAATFPDGKDHDGLAGLRAYLKEKRQDDFVDNLCKKLFSYALSRSLQLSDKKALDAMRTKLAADEFRFGGLVESMVTSPQFLHKRGREVASE